MSIKMLLVQEFDKGNARTVYYGPTYGSTIDTGASARMKKAWKTRKAKTLKK